MAYLDLLVAGNLEAAYERTQLSELGSFTRAAALSEAHFVAFFDGDPVIGYEIGRVTAFRPEGGDPLWDAEVTLRTADGARTEDMQVEGEVLGVVTVQPVALHVRATGDGVPRIAVDGVEVDVSDARLAARERTWQLLVLGGRHRIEVDGQTVRFSTHPPRVIEGSASFEGSAGPTGDPLTLVLR